MQPTETIRRQFQVTKDDGSLWDMNYTGRGVQWRRRDPSSSHLATGTGPSFPPMGGPLEVIASVADAAARIAMWWEVRQQRLLEEAAHEETRRIPWLTDMIARWGDAHRTGDHLDLRLSEYLAREAQEMMQALASNKKASVPHSVLYEMDLIQDCFRAFRGQLLEQFEALDRHAAISEALHQSLPRRSLNLGLVRELGKDPAIAWASQVRTKNNAAFDQEYAQAFRHPDVFLQKLFPSNEAATSETKKEEGRMSRLLGVVARSLPHPDSFKSTSWDRRDAFRELSLFPAEVSRVQALHSAWLATCAAIGDYAGSALTTSIGPTGTHLALGSGQTALQGDARAEIEG